MLFIRRGKCFGYDNANYKNTEHYKRVLRDTWELTDKDGNVIIIESLSKYCRDNNLNVSCMRDISYGRQKSHKGWVNVKKLTNNVKNKKR